MRKSVLRKLDFRTAHLDYLVVFCTFSRNYQVTRYIWKQNQLGLKLFACSISLCEKFAGFCLEFGNFLLGLFSLCFLAFFHEAADKSGLLFLL